MIKRNQIIKFTFQFYNIILKSTIFLIKNKIILYYNKKIDKLA